MKYKATFRKAAYTTKEIEAPSRTQAWIIAENLLHDVEFPADPNCSDYKIEVISVFETECEKQRRNTMENKMDNIIEEIRIDEQPKLSPEKFQSYGLSIKYSNDQHGSQIEVHNSRELAELIRTLLLKYGKNINIKQDKIFPVYEETE